MIIQKLKEVFSNEKLSVFLVEDHPLLREGIKRLFKLYFPTATIVSAESYSETRELLRDKYDLVLLDNSLNKWPDAGEITGVKTIPLIREYNPNTFILFISNQVDIGAILLEKGEVDYCVDKAQIGEFFQEVKSLH